MIKRVFCLLLCFLAAIVLDASLLPRLLPYAVRPSLVTAFVLALSVSYSLWIAGAAAALGGLAEDMLCSESIGLSSAVFILGALILSSLLQKNTFKKGILYLLMTAVVLLGEALSAGFFRLFGAKFDILYTFFFDGLGRSLVTSGCALLFIALCAKLNRGRIERA